MYGCVLTDVATDALVLQHQDIRSPSTDQIFIVVDQFQTKTWYIKKNTLEYKTIFLKRNK